MQTKIRQNSPAFDPVAYLARRYRVSPARARLIAELGGIGKIYVETATAQMGGRK